MPEYTPQQLDEMRLKRQIERMAAEQSCPLPRPRPQAPETSKPYNRSHAQKPIPQPIVLVDSPASEPGPQGREAGPGVGDAGDQGKEQDETHN